MTILSEINLIFCAFGQLVTTFIFSQLEISHVLNRTTPEIQQENEDLRLESDSKVPTSVLNEEEINLDLLDLLPEGIFFILANFPI